MTSSSTIDPRLAEAVIYLASVCDRANADDARGFSAADVGVGHALAQLPLAQWDDDCVAVAKSLCLKYQGQLRTAGIAPELPADLAVGGMERDLVRSKARAHENKQRRVMVLNGDGAIVVSFPYDAQILAELKARVPPDMRRWDGGAKTWVVQPAAIRVVRELADKWEFRCDNGTLALPDVEPPTVEPEPEGVHVACEDGVFAVAFSYAPETVDAIKRVPGRFYVPADKTWRVPLASAEELAVFCEATSAQLTDAAAEALDGFLSSHHENIAASKRADAVDIEIPNLAEGVELLPFQSSGVAYAARSGRCIIGDDMGLGKTIQALSVLEIRGAFPAIVVCPATLKGNWAREVGKFFPHRSVEIVSGTKALDDYRNADITILNYDILAAHCGMKGGSGKAKPQFENLDLFVQGARGLVFDEAHRLKERTSKRTKAALAVAEAMPSDATVLCLTGTPFKNRHAEIWPLIQIVGHSEFFGAWTQFAKRYCDMHQRNIGGRLIWDTSGSSHGQELNDRMRGGGFYVRRAKRDVLTELEPKRRIPLLVEGDAKVMAEYRKAEADLIEYLQDMARRVMDELGPDAGKEAWQKAMRAAAVEHLIKVGYCKRLATKAKVPAAIDWIDTFLDTDPDAKLLVFAHHLDAIEKLVEKYQCPKIIGGVPNDERMQIVDRFQTDPSVRVLVLGITAAGEGLTLTQAHDVLFLEQGWTEAEQAQCEDRAYGRVSDLHSINAYYMLCDGTIDTRIYNLIEAKGAMAKTAADGHGAASSHTSVASDLLAGLVSEKG